MRLPVTQTHPTKVVFAMKALHVITSAILLNANVTLGTIFRVCRNVIGRFTVIRTLGQPFFDHGAIGGRMIIRAASKTKRGIALITYRLLGLQVRTANDHRAIRSRTET